MPLSDFSTPTYFIKLVWGAITDPKQTQAEKHKIALFSVS
jgi:hypothetical protein